MYVNNKQPMMGSTTARQQLARIGVKAKLASSLRTSSASKQINSPGQQDSTAARQLTPALTSSLRTSSIYTEAQNMVSMLSKYD